MASNAIVNTLLKSLMPTVRKIVDGGKIDALFQDLKGRYDGLLHAEENSVEILVTTEEDGNEYVNVVETTPEMKIVSVFFQQRLTKLVTTLFTQADL